VARDIILLQIIQTASGTHPASYSTAIWVLSWIQSGKDVMLTTCLHLAPRLRSRIAVSLLSLYAFMVWTRTALLFAPNHIPIAKKECWFFALLCL